MELIDTLSPVYQQATDFENSKTEATKRRVATIIRIVRSSWRFSVFYSLVIHAAYMLTKDSNMFA
jgi:hypothetical protein